MSIKDDIRMASEVNLFEQQRAAEIVSHTMSFIATVKMPDGSIKIISGFHCPEDDPEQDCDIARMLYNVGKRVFDEYEVNNESE